MKGSVVSAATALFLWAVAAIAGTACAAAERERLFTRLGVDSIPVSTDRPYVEPLETFFRRRAKRAGPLLAAGGRR